jgi:hypothetical protein
MKKCELKAGEVGFVASSKEVGGVLVCRLIFRVPGAAVTQPTSLAGVCSRDMGASQRWRYEEFAFSFAFKEAICSTLIGLRVFLGGRLTR